MDLSDNSSIRDTVEQFIADVQLAFANWVKLNGPDHAISLMGRRSEEFSIVGKSMGWDPHFAPGRKLSILCSILIRSSSRLAGSTAAGVPQGMIFFRILFRTFLWPPHFEWGQKTMLT
jgi:hypothetical protein